jgi:hypothetical protein
MTSSFTNKRKEEKLKRYYYYRCTSTTKKDWNVCSTRQVSANRLENFVIHNLDRISNDRPYIENLTFRLNNDPEAGYRSGLELTEICSSLSPEILQDILKLFLKILAQQKGIERNLLIKNFIKNILYSKDQIQINLYYSKFDALKNSVLPFGDGLDGYKKEKRTSVRKDRNSQFELFRLAPRTGLEPRG